MSYEYKLEDVKAAARGRVREILERVGIPAEYLSGRQGPCPKCRTGDDRWRYVVDEEKVFCNQCPKAKMRDVIGAVQWWLDISFRDALETVAKIVGIEPQPFEKPPKKTGIDANLHWANYQDWQFAQAVQQVCKTYGATPETIKACGGRMATYRIQHLVIAFPTMNKDGLTGWYLQATRKPGLPTWPQGAKGPIEYKKRKATAGSKAGLLLPVDLQSAREIWKVEGLSDYLGFMALPDRPEDVVAITNTGGAGQAIQEWYLSHWQGKAAYVVGDCDTPGQECAERWALRLAEVATSSVIVPLPYECTNGKDLRDYIAEGRTYADLKRLAGEAGIAASDIKPREKTKPSEPGCSAEISAEIIVIPYYNPRHLAGQHLKRYAKKRENATLGFHRSAFYKYNGTTWKPVGIDDLKARVRGTIEDVFQEEWERQEPDDNGEKKPLKSVYAENVSGTIDTLKTRCLIPESVELNTYFDREKDVRERRNYLRLANGILDIDALLRDEPLETVLLPHTSHWFSTVCLPYPLDLEADCPKWHAFLERSVSDPQLIAMLQEWFGYCLTYDTSHHKLLLLHGEGANGKSVICGALEALIGRDNCSNVALEEFGDKFAFGSTLGKLVNISPDSGQLEHEAEGRLKSYTSGNKMSFDRKNLPRIDMVPTARLVVSTNDRPKFRDRSGGVWRRLLLLPMTTVIPEKEKILGMDEIKWWEQSGELPGMLLWALRGLARLKRQKAFTVPLVSAAELEQYRDEQNPARVFLRDYTQASDDAEVKTEELYFGYVAWCDSHGHKPVPDTNFGKEVKRFHDVEKRRTRIPGSEKRQNVYPVEYCPDGCVQMGEF